MPVNLPQPPRSRGVVGLILTVAFVGWTIFLLTRNDEKKPVAAAKAKPTPSFIEIDLRGPQFELGRYQGYQAGLKGNPSAVADAASKVEPDDYTAGYRSGYTFGQEKKTAQ